MMLLPINAPYDAYTTFSFRDLYSVYTHATRLSYDSYKTSLRPGSSKLYCSQVNEQSIQILSNLIVPYGDMKHDYYSK